MHILSKIYYRTSFHDPKLTSVVLNSQVRAYAMLFFIRCLKLKCMTLRWHHLQIGQLIQN
jgi:hypothetical protein